MIHTDNGKEFCGRAMLTWDHAHRVTLRLIEPGKPNQNAYIESSNGRFRDECLNEHWFLNLAHAQAVIEAWRCEYNEKRPKKVVGGLPPPPLRDYCPANQRRKYLDSKHGCYSRREDIELSVKLSPVLQSVPSAHTSTAFGGTFSVNVRKNRPAKKFSTLVKRCLDAWPASSVSLLYSSGVVVLGGKFNNPMPRTVLNSLK